jgi:hypothetical protein
MEATHDQVVTGLLMWKAEATPLTDALGTHAVTGGYSAVQNVACVFGTHRCAAGVAGRQHDSSRTLRSDQQRPASQRSIIKLLNRRVERIHVGVSNDAWPNPLCANHCKSLD